MTQLRAKMSGYRYPIKSLGGDYMRAGLGMAVIALPLIGASSVPVVFVILVALFLMFLGFGLQTLSRHMTMITLEPDRLLVFGLRRKQIKWEEIVGVGLKYYSTKKDRGSGWMELTVKTPSSQTKIDSSLDGFNEIAAKVAGVAEENGTKIDEDSIENFAAIGVELRHGELDKDITST